MATPFHVTAVMLSAPVSPATYTRPMVLEPETATDVGVCDVDTAEIPPNAIAIV